MASLLLYALVAWSICFVAMVATLIAARWSITVRDWLLGNPAGSVASFPTPAARREPRKELRQAA